MNEEQKAILSSFPKKDMGIFGEEEDEDEEAPQLVEVEEDFVQAAAKKAKLKQQAMRAKKLARE